MNFCWFLRLPNGVEIDSLSLVNVKISWFSLVAGVFMWMDVWQYELHVGESFIHCPGWLGVRSEEWGLRWAQLSPADLWPAGHVVGDTGGQSREKLWEIFSLALTGTGWLSSDILQYRPQSIVHSPYSIQSMTVCLMQIYKEYFLFKVNIHW